jgi:hypothetical protein
MQSFNFADAFHVIYFKKEHSSGHSAFIKTLTNKIQVTRIIGFADPFLKENTLLLMQEKNNYDGIIVFNPSLHMA